MDSAGRIWEGDSVQLATKEVRLSTPLGEVLNRKLKRRADGATGRKS